MTRNQQEANRLLEEALRLVPDDPLIISLEGLHHAMQGNREAPWIA